MFESLTERLNKVFQKLGGKGRLTEKDVDESLREVRLALLEADVSLRVVKEFIARVRERSLGSDVMESLTPGQQIIKFVHEELVTILGKTNSRMNTAAHPPSVLRP